MCRVWGEEPDGVQGKEYLHHARLGFITVAGLFRMSEVHTQCWMQELTEQHMQPDDSVGENVYMTLCCGSTDVSSQSRWLWTNQRLTSFYCINHTPVFVH